MFVIVRPTFSAPSARLRLGARRVHTTNAPQATRTTQEFIQLCETTNRGANTTSEQRDDIMAQVESYAQQGKGSTTTDETLSGTWRMLWTTEKETLFITERAGWFGTKAGEVYQVIDVGANTLQNVITFPPDGAFIVDSSIAVENAQRVNFKFGGAKLKLPKRDIKVPPVGQGWFESVYCDKDIRIARDIRGDTLICARDGPPRVFT